MSWLQSLGNKLLSATSNHGPEENVLNNDRKLVFYNIVCRGENPYYIAGIRECNNICAILPVSLCYVCLLLLGHC